MVIISVILPVYNTEQYLRRCIDSILAQTFKDFELIIVNDGSTDNSGSICDEYSALDSRIRVIHQDNQGVSIARNTAIGNAIGEYVAFVDSDDSLSEQCLETLYSAIIDNNADISVSPIQMIEENGNRLHRNVSGKRVYYDRDIIEHFGTLNNDTFRCTLSKLIPLRIVRQSLFPPERHFAEDFAVVYRWYNMANSVVEIDDAVYFYFVRKGSAVHSDYSIERLGDIETLEELLSFLKINDYCDLYKLYLHKYLWHLSNNIFSIDPILYKNTRKILIRKIKKTIKNNYKIVSPETDPDAFNYAYPICMGWYWTIKFFINRKKDCNNHNLLYHK